MAGKGKEFEKAFKDSVPKEFVCYRLKDAPKDFKNENLKFSPSNIADFMLANPFTRKCHFIELKEVSNTSLPFANINFKHIDEMMACERVGFFESYLIVRFKEKRTGTYALKVSDVNNFRLDQIEQNSNKKSYPFDWIVENGIQLPERMVRVNYRIDLTPAFGKGDDF